MIRLLVDSIRCIRRSTEVGDDEIYLLAVIAEPYPPHALRVRTVGPTGLWRAFRTGRVDPTDVTIDSDYHPHRIYFVTLLEQDAARDYDLAHARDALTAELSLLFQTFASVHTITKRELEGFLRPEVEQGIVRYRLDDDPIGRTVALGVPAGTNLMTHEFRCREGHYEVRFKLDE